MALSSSRPLSKAFLFLFIFALILASFNLPFIFHNKFLEIKTSIEKDLSIVLGRDVVVGGMEFSPYGRAAFTSIVIKGKPAAVSDIKISRLNIRFSVWELLSKKKAKRLHLKGNAVFTEPGFIGDVRYGMDVIVTPEVISIGSLSLCSKKFIIDIRGNINNYRASPELGLIISSKEIDLAGAAKINNLQGSLEASRDRLLIKEFNFFLNSFPIGIACEISDFKDTKVRLSIKSYPGQLPSLRPLNPFNFEMDFSGKKEEDSLKGGLTIAAHSLVSKDPIKISDAYFKADGVSLSVLNKVVSVKAKEIFYNAPVSGRNVSISGSDIETFTYLGRRKVFLTGMRGSICQGFFHGYGFVDYNKHPAKLLLDFKTRNMDVADLARSIGLGYELSGTLNFKGTLNNRRDPFISGKVDIVNGYMKDIKLLNMVSDFLSVPSLREAHFKSLSSMINASWVTKEISFNKFAMLGTDMILSGDLKINTSKKLNGSISARLSTAILKESFRLRMLFFIIGERLEYQDFEFDVGGKTSSPQIKWLSTRFRENVGRYLSGSGKKAVEESLEQAINSLVVH